MKGLTIILFLLVVLGTNAQPKSTLQEMKMKTDSILSEADLLYQFEKAAWISTDSARVKQELKGKIGSYIVYKNEETICVVFLDKMASLCLYELKFNPFLDVPYKQIMLSRTLTDKEKGLYLVKEKMIQQVTDNKYPLSCPTGYNLNAEIIPYAEGYKLYLITGTGQDKVIPFGNDYLFWGDGKGNILNWKKFHSRLIPQPTQYEGSKVTEITHSHLRQEPFMSATDICTFRLYGSFYDMDEFSVYSPALSVTFTYKLKSNSIEIKAEK